ncbi:MAG: aminodeoxychorismate/anthranilate synthase component II [Bacteroidales bacterium]
MNINDKILVFDNYDSFTYNLVEALKISGCTNIDVFRNDKISLEDVDKYDRIVISPGPGIPKESGILLNLLKRYSPYKKIFGVCLGLQAIGERFGGQLENIGKVFHGVATNINITQEDSLFEGIGNKDSNSRRTFMAGRYHSWILSRDNLPDCLQVIAEDDTGEIMAIKHKEYNVYAVQFHPESILSPEGQLIINNWLKNK